LFFTERIENIMAIAITGVPRPQINSLDLARNNYITEECFGDYLKHALKAARQLGYDKEVLQKLGETTRVTQIQQIMAGARHRMAD
jgi:tRNA A-37 threonylcarbamoyl transferase component Bud32